MKKNYLLGMFAATGMLLATSCSNDELAAAQSGNEAQVTFSLGLENGIGSRALISDGTKADKLVYAVYKLDDQNKPVLQHVIGSNSEGQFVKDDFKSGDNVTVTLAKGQTYQVAFWAQDGDCTAYTTADLTNVLVDYAADNNAEVRDAFFKTVEFTVAANKTIDVVMKRPFAQINVGVYESDWDAAVASGIKIEESKVVINNAANSINLLTGAVDGSVEVTYDLSAIPTETLEVETDETNPGKEEYKWLSMSYILVADNSTTDEDNDGTLGDARTTLESLNYTFAPESGNNITFAEGLNSVPVQRNWRTNILGKILTGDIQFNITIDPVYDGDHNYPGVGEQELEFAAIYGGTINATEDIDLGGDYLNIKSDLILNMDGNTLEVAQGQVAGYGALLTNGATAEFNDANIVSGGAGINVQSGSKVEFNSGSILVNSDTNSGQRYIFYAAQQGSTVTINGGSFSFVNVSRKIAYICADRGAKVYVTGGEFGAPCQHPSWKEPIVEANDGEVIISGGTFGFDPTTWVATGYKAIEKDNKWYVVADEIETVATSDAELRDALSGGKNVALADDVSTIKAGSNGNGGTGINVNGGVFDGNGHTIEVEGATGTWDSAIAIKGGTIKNLTVAKGFRGIFITKGTEKVVLENVVVEGPTYTISCDAASQQGLEAYNSTFNGWTSYAGTLGTAYFKDCSFGPGAGNNFSRPYAPTTYVNCEFATGHKMDPRAAVTFENCTIGGVALTSANLATLVINNISNATVK